MLLAHLGHIGRCPKCDLTRPPRLLHLVHALLVELEHLNREIWKVDGAPSERGCGLDAPLPAHELDGLDNHQEERMNDSQRHELVARCGFIAIFQPAML